MYNAKERAIFRKLNTPLKIQLYLDKVPINFEPKGDTCSSVRTSLKRGTMHCIEAALFAAAALEFHGNKAWILDLKANKKDYDHVICLFKKNGLLGAISKSNHAALRYREPVYATPRELAMSCFHEYINEKGDKTLRSFSIALPSTKLLKGWQTNDEELWDLEHQLNDIKHFNIVPRSLKLRRADEVEIVAGNIKEWSAKDGKKIKF